MKPSALIAMVVTLAAFIATGCPSSAPSPPSPNLPPNLPPAREGFSLNPTALPFGNQMINTTSAPGTVTLTNIGTASAPWDFLEIKGATDFAQTNNCPSTIDAGASCTFSVTFRPTAVRDRTALLLFESLIAVTLTGTGIPATTGPSPAITTLSPSSTNFGGPQGKLDSENHKPTFTTIEPTDSDGTFTSLFDINDRGKIVGAYNSGGHRYGFLRSKDGNFTRINFPDSFRTHADAINPRGDIVGWYARVPGEIHGYLRKKSGQFVQIDFPGAMDTRAIGINPRGDIVGFYCLVVPPQCRSQSVNKSAHGFLLREGQFMTIDFPGALETYAYKINPRGQVLGRYRGPEGRSHLFLLSEREFTTSNMPGAFETVSLPPIPPQLWFTTIDFPGAIETAIDGANAGLNSRGDIVGDYCAVPPLPCKPENVHGFLLSEGEFTTIDVPGVLGTSAYGINAHGDIVGFFNVDANHSVGFLRSRRERDEDKDE